MWPNINGVNFVEDWQKFNFIISYWFESNHFVAIVDMLSYFLYDYNHFELCRRFNLLTRNFCITLYKTYSFEATKLAKGKNAESFILIKNLYTAECWKYFEILDRMSASHKITNDAISGTSHSFRNCDVFDAFLMWIKSDDAWWWPHEPFIFMKNMHEHVTC